MRQQSTVTTWAKKNFMLWFMENYPLRDNGGRKILTYLLEKKPALGFLHIIENGSLFRPLLVISSEDTAMPSCLLMTVKETISIPMSSLSTWKTSMQARAISSFSPFTSRTGKNAGLFGRSPKRGR